MEKKHTKQRTGAELKPSHKALARYHAVSWLADRMKDDHPDRGSLSNALRDAALREWDGFIFSMSTLERFHYLYKEGGFTALCEKPRSDRGQSRKLNDEQRTLLLSMRKKHKSLNVTVLLDKLHEESGMDLLESVSISTVYRELRKHGLDKATMRSTFDEPSSGPQKAFEMPLPNMVWMSDMMHGMTLTTADGKIKTRLFAFIDDHSRLCVGARYFDSESLDCVLEVLREAVLRRGVPEKIYTDQGKVFTSKHLKMICANLGIKLSHARPYHAWSKGKVERFFRTLQDQFQALLIGETIASLDELNERLQAWIEQTYHQRIHRGTGQTPLQRFSDGVDCIKAPPSAEALDQLFMKRDHRRVGKDGCISLENNKLEAPLSLRGHRVEVRYPVPLDLRAVQIYYQERFIALATPLNKHLNAKTFKRKKS